MAEAATTLFVMHGAREVLAFGAIHLEQQIVALEGAAASNPGLAFDLAKTLIESACKTVLSERACAYDGGWDLPRLLKETLENLQLVPAQLVVSKGCPKACGGWPVDSRRRFRESASYATPMVLPHTARTRHFNSWTRSKRCLSRAQPMPS